MCSLRDAATALRDAEIRVIGISVDDVNLLRKFADEKKLAFELLSDTDGSVARKYHALHDNGVFANRVTVTIDPAGRLRHIETKVDVRQHAKQIIGRIQSLIADK